MQLLIYFFIAIGLSMDAFTLALAYGINKISLKKVLELSIIVGIFHFIMPLLGSIIGLSIINNLITKTNKIVGVVLLLIAIEMFISRNEEKKIIITNMISILVFSLTVSIDSFSVGIALSLTEKDPLIAYTLFSIVSCIFTLSGLLLGKKLSNKLGKKGIYLGIFILIYLAIKYIVS